MNAPAHTPRPAWTPARFWSRQGERLVCELCPFACALADGGTGRCRVRRRRGDGLETATMATAVLHLHAIERKPFFHFRPGRPALTLAPPGCTFACDYCQNHRLSQYGRSVQAPWSATPLCAGEAVDRAQAAGAVLALSYSEPTLAAELTGALHEHASPRGIEIVWKTNGFVTPSALRTIAPWLAAVNVDVKSPDPARHEQLTGAPLRPVLDAVHGFAARGVWVELSTPVIPGFNDDPASLRALAAFVRSVGPSTPWHLLRFHPEHRRLHPGPTSPRLLEQARSIAHEAGLRHVYVERALGDEGRATRCPGCGDAVVHRDLWALRESRLVGGACPRCKTAIEGRW